MGHFEAIFLNEKKCAKCGKNFIAQHGHIYRDHTNKKTKWYCSWTCYNHRNDKNEKEKKENELD